MRKILIMLALAIGVAACAPRPDAAELLARAEASAMRADTIAARDLCAELSDTARYDLAPSQLCRQALVYARISELCDNSDDMAAAAKCYARALAISPDSVRAFAETLPVSDLAAMRMIRDVSQAAECADEAIIIPDDEAPQAPEGEEDAP